MINGVKSDAEHLFGGRNLVQVHSDHRSEVIDACLSRLLLLAPTLALVGCLFVLRIPISRATEPLRAVAFLVVVCSPVFVLPVSAYGIYVALRKEKKLTLQGCLTLVHAAGIVIACYIVHAVLSFDVVIQN